ncbi:hypothetical protein PHMEG_0005010, partial [Phytophthora megakarya]
MEIISGPYSARNVKPLVDKLSLLPDEVHGEVSVRQFNIGQPVPMIKTIPQAEKIHEGIQAIDATNNLKFTRSVGWYDCVTYGQLKLMDSAVKAKNNFRLVQAKVDWIEKLQFRVDSIVPPFKDTADITKEVYKIEVENKNLGKWFIGKHAQFDVEFLVHENVDPRFHDSDTTEQKLRIAQSYGAAESGVKKVICVINRGHHWGYFYVDVKVKKCFIFNPMLLGSNISMLKAAVGTVIERILDMTDQLQYEVITGCTQKDGTSCELWRLVVLGLLLFGATIEDWNNVWSDTLYNEFGLLQMRYLKKISTINLEH